MKRKNLTLTGSKDQVNFLNEVSGQSKATKRVNQTIDIGFSDDAEGARLFFATLPSHEHELDERIRTMSVQEAFQALQELL